MAGTFHDDADVMMLREDYERFKTVANQMDPKLCYFQDNDTDPEYRWGYGKIRRTGTTYIRVGQNHLKCKTGFYIDVLPLDDIPLSVPGQLFNDFYCFCLRKILWSEVGKYSESESSFARGVYRLLSHIPPQWVFRRMRGMTKKSRNSSPNKVRILLFPAVGKLYRGKDHPLRERYGMPKNWFTELAEYEFEGKMFWGTKDYDTAMEYEYGDYMQLPPEEKRIPHACASEYDFGPCASICAK